jgi:hypothetical protein
VPTAESGNWKTMDNGNGVISVCRNAKIIMKKEEGREK